MRQNNPWLTLWTQPRSTIRNILETDPLSKIILLSILNGLLASLTWLVTYWIRYPQEKGFSHPLFIILVLIVGMISGLINLYLGAILYRLTGSWIGGKGTFQDVKCAVGWSNYPFLISALFGLFAIFLTKYPLMQFPFLFLKVATFIWGFIIFLKILGEAHRFSAWRALATLVISFAIIFAVAFTISLLILSFSTQPIENSKAIKIYSFFS